MPARLADLARWRRVEGRAASGQQQGHPPKRLVCPKTAAEVKRATSSLPPRWGMKRVECPTPPHRTETKKAEANQPEGRGFGHRFHRNTAARELDLLHFLETLRSRGHDLERFDCLAVQGDHPYTTKVGIRSREAGKDEIEQDIILIR